MPWQALPVVQASGLLIFCLIAILALTPGLNLVILLNSNYSYLLRDLIESNVRGSEAAAGSFQASA
jgi:hypothetical protein